MFSTTQWTVVFRAASEESNSGRPALGAVMEKYWHPLYAFARQQGLSRVDAEDATQSFLVELIHGNLLEKADPAKGRFRTYLLTAWKRFLIDRDRSEHSAKRGGRAQIYSLSAVEAESNWRSLSAVHAPPDELFMSAWAVGLVDEALDRLKREYVKGNRLATFDALLPVLTTLSDQNLYQKIATELSISEGAAKVSLHRFRQRFAATLREVTAQTIEDPSDLDQEMDELLKILAKR
jgi:RNA polymerase sigma factor (sigma-70 family)